MVQLSIQDMTQESKVRTRTALCVCGGGVSASVIGRTVLGMKSPLWAVCKGKGFLEKQEWYRSTSP